MTHPPDPVMKIDQEGFLVTGADLRVQDEKYGAALLTRMVMQESGRLFTSYEGQKIRLLAFDRPLVIQMVEKAGDAITLKGPYGTSFDFDLKSLSLDAWDRFHGKTTSGVPFVFSRKAQNEFFSLLEEFEDDWVKFQGQEIPTPSFYIEDESVSKSSFWQDKYVTGATGWDRAEAAPALVRALKSLKLTKQRVAVLGCGTGEDAAHFAAQGHLVTAFDFSPAGLDLARKKHEGKAGLKFVLADVLNLPQEFHGKFDLIFDNAFFIALPPSLRPNVVKAYKKILSPEGSLLGVFALFPHRGGPPFGLTEWEMQQHLGGDFQHLYWSRETQSESDREELIVYSQLKNKG